MKPETSDPEIPEIFTNRNSLLKANSKLISQLQKRVTSTRFRVQEGDNVRLAYIRALTNLILAQNTILKEVELEKLEKELEELKNLINERSHIQSNTTCRLQ